MFIYLSYLKFRLIKVNGFLSALLGSIMFKF
jgi:hypothetical protein